MVSALKVAATSVYQLFQFICLVVSQILLVEIISSKGTTDPNVWFANILILLTFPEMVILLYDVWMSNIIAQSRYRHWPDIKILINGFLIFVMDAIALGLLTTVVLPNFPPFLLPCISCLGVSPLHTSEHNDKDIPTGCNGRKVIIPISQLVLLLGTSVLVVFSDILSIECAFLFGISLLAINLIRFTPLQNHIYSNKDTEAQNAGLLYRFVHLITIISTVWIVFIHGQDNKYIYPSFADATIGPMFNMVTVVSICILLLQTETFIQKHKIRTAMLSSLNCFCGTLVVFMLTLYMWIHKFDFGIFKHIPKFPISFSVFHIILYSFICVSVVLFYFVTFYDIQEESFVNKNSFVIFYDNIFQCQNLIRNIFCKAGYSTKPTNKFTRVFICTTMYQESAYEMSRLLRSLKKLSSSKSIQKRNIYVESHIFLDNGAKGRDVKEFGIQLLSLVEKTFEMEEQYGVMIHTPYGIKFSWNVPGEMPLFLHLKDVSLVKAKKRWSQVMYMRYILQYRARFHRLYQKTENPLNYNVSDLIDVNIETDVVHSDTHTSNGTVPVVTFDTSSKASSFSDLTTVTQLEDADNKKKESQRFYDPIESEFANNDKQELTLRVPRLHFNSKNRRSSFDHSFISLGNLPKRSHSFDLDLQTDELPYNFSETKIRSSSFNDIEFEYHKFKQKELEQQQTDTLGDEKYQDFILATDADMAFDAQSVINVLNTIESDENIGGVCGRTFPIGIHRHPIVWLQIFDYAKAFGFNILTTCVCALFKVQVQDNQVYKDFWMIKSAQNIIGSVMCCPGCFSLYRFEAIDDVLETFSEPTKSMSDVFTKDNGEDRWMCTLMMKAGWSLKYSFHGKNTTFCPEETEEFMKQRRRWLLSDFANAAVVAGNLLSLMRSNAAFTLVYTLYLIQLFIVMLLYPGSTIVMLALGFELVTNCPLIVNAAFLSIVCLVYCIIQISSWNAYRKLIVNKVLILVLGFLTTYVFIATSVFIVETMLKDIILGEMTAHIANLVLVGVIVVYLYSSLLHPTELHLLSTGIVYLFYLPLLNILLPLYAVCNIVDQTWGTRDDQKASVPRILRLPKFKKRNKRKSLKYRSNSYESLSSSAMDLQNISEDETMFWQTLVAESIGVHVNPGLSTEERTKGLRPLRNRVLAGYLVLNLFWVALLTGFYAFLTSFFTDKLVYGVIVLCLLGVSAVIQLLGMTVYRVSDLLTRFGRQIV